VASGHYENICLPSRLGTPLVKRGVICETRTAHVFLAIEGDRSGWERHLQQGLDLSSIQDPQMRVATEPATAEELRLVADVLQKDRKATAEFVSRYADGVYAYVRRRLAPRCEPLEDLVQETFLAAWRSLPSFCGQSRLQSWLLGIARHKVEDHYRKRLRDSKISDDTGDSTPEPSIVVNFDEGLDRLVCQQEIQRTLGSIPEHYAVALLWRYLDNKSVREMAELTGCTEKAMERLLARAREQFRRRWQDVHR